MANFITRDPKKLLYDSGFLGLGSEINETHVVGIQFVPDLISLDPVDLSFAELTALIDILENEKDGKFNPFEGDFPGSVDWIGALMKIGKNKFVKGGLVKSVGDYTLELQRTIWNGEYRAKIDEEETDFDEALRRLGFEFVERDVNLSVERQTQSHIYFFERGYDRDIEGLELQRELFIDDRRCSMDTFLFIDAQYRTEKFELRMDISGNDPSPLVSHLGLYFQNLRAGRRYMPPQNDEEDTSEFDPNETVEIPVYKP